MPVRDLLFFLAITLLIVNGCAGWTPQNVVHERESVTDNDNWQTRETKPGQFGVDPRARDIERNLGIR